MEIDIGLVGFALVAVLTIIGWAVNARLNPKPVFDRKRRELRYGRETPIPFGELEVRVFRYRLEEDPADKGGIGGPLWGGLAAGVR
jgi:hypothetical protein